MRHHRATLAVALLAGLVPVPMLRADTPTPTAVAPAKPAVRSQLPTETDYQRDLREFLGTLTAKDFEHGVSLDAVKPVPVNDPDELYRIWTLTLEVPRIGRKRSYPSMNLPAEQFTLAAIENPTRGIVRPACWPEPTVWFAHWNYAGNPFYGSRAVKLRAFVTSTVLMLMMDDSQRHPASKKDTRSDWFALHLICYGYTLRGVQDVLPPKARDAYRACLRGMMQRVAQWGPTGDETHADISAVLGMRLAADAIGDVESKKLAEDYARRIFNSLDYYDPAGYFPDQGCFDSGFNGLSLYYGTWLALEAPDWPFVQDAVKKAIRLRGYTLMPEPDGAFVGPSHASARTGTDATNDQWNWKFRHTATALLTDDGIAQAIHPTKEQLQAAPAAVMGEVHEMLRENPGYLPNDKLVSQAWGWSLFPNSMQFPMNNFAFDFYHKGFAARMEELTAKNSPLLKYPFQRDGSFTESAGKSFLWIKRDKTYGLALHTGPVSEFKGEGHQALNGPYGLSGGTLSAFWTPETGTVLLGRRRGMRITGPDSITFDKVEEWRTWPVHAVSGTTATGKFFTSARIQNPNPVYELSDKKSVVKVGGVIPAAPIGTDVSLEGKIDYARVFTADEKGLAVETAVSGDGKDSIGELYEVLPVFHNDGQQKMTATIEFEVGGKWAEATTELTSNVAAVRIKRFNGAVDIRFDRPRRLKLSTQNWQDNYISRATCRNVLVDLLESNAPTPVKDVKKIAYRIAPAAK